jgi:hypothetical protein
MAPKESPGETEGRMNLSEFYGWQVAWYVFGTLSAFAAALLFWSKGAAAIGGKLTPAGETRWKLSGAAAIFVIVVIVFHYISPLKDLADYKSVLVIYRPETQPNETKGANRVPVTIRANEIKADWINLNPDKMVIEMIPFESIVSLLPEGNGNSFSTAGAIAYGTYKVRVIERDTGKAREFKLDVPPRAEN